MNTITTPTTAPGVPCLPESAPFTPAQRAWLNGFLAGMFSSAPGGAAPAPAPVQLSLQVLFGSESGNSEALARRLVKAAGKRGLQAKALGLDKIAARDLAQAEYVLLVTSTFGDGEPPENAKAFHAALHAADQPRLEKLRFAVLALGDTNYEKFCQCGREFDARLAALGAQRLYERAECDADFEAPFEAWQEGVFTVLEALGNKPPAPESAPAAAPLLPEPKPEPELVPAGFSKANPFPARLIANRRLTAEGSGKETRHFEISLAGSGLTYEVGDALGVIPTNCPALVDDLLRALNCDGEEAVPSPTGEMPLRTALLRHYEISKISPSLLKTISERSSDKTLADLMVPAAKEALSHYLYGRETIDLLLDFSSVTFTPADFVAQLRTLQPRLYSISSSLHAFPKQVHLTVAMVRYEAFGRPRKGVCSTFLADRASGPVPVYVQTSHGFRLPKLGTTPIVMVGPGTGVAPFRAFLHDRRAAGATGRNWLFFGERSAATDFYYREELETMARDGHLSRLSTAFSRDQAEKIYVQQRMEEEGAELWAWLEEGAHFYVCGDARRMAKDVDAALQAVVRKHGSLSPEGAAEYLKKLKTEKRYQRDVY